MVSSSEAAWEGACDQGSVQVIDVIDISVRVRCSEAQCEGAYDKGSAQAP